MRRIFGVCLYNIYMINLSKRSNFMKKNIILIGFMATGKTTIGENLAKKLNMPFFDTDYLIENIEQKSIESIFSTKGEEYFRQKEQEILQTLKKKEQAIISTGGGIVINPINREILLKMGTIIHLQAEKDWIIKNIKRSNVQRPLLKSSDIEQKIINILKERKPFYEIADYKIKVDNLEIEEIIEKLCHIVASF